MFHNPSAFPGKMVKQGSISDDAFFILEASDVELRALESRATNKKNDFSNRTMAILSDDDDDFESPPMSPVKRRSSSTKKRPSSSKRSIRNDRGSMSLKSKRVEAKEPTKRKLDFSSAFNYNSDNSELSGTDEDSYEEELPPLKPNRTRRHRESLMSNVTPQITTRSKKRGTILDSIDLESDDDEEIEESVPASIFNEKKPPPISRREKSTKKKQILDDDDDASIEKKPSPTRKKPAKFSSILDDEPISDGDIPAPRRASRKTTSILDDDDDESETYAVKPVRKAKSIFDEHEDDSESYAVKPVRKKPAKSKKRKSILDDDYEDDQEFDPEIPMAKRKHSPGKLKVRSTIYPLPVVEPTPVPERSAKKRRTRKVITSDDEDEQDEKSLNKKNVTPIATIVLDHSPQRVRSGPSPVAKEIMESAKKKPGSASSAGLEWYQERAIADFSDDDDDDDDTVLTKLTPKRKKKGAERVENPSRVPSISEYCKTPEKTRPSASWKPMVAGASKKSIFIGNEEISSQAQPIKRPRSPPAATKRPSSQGRLTLKHPSNTGMETIILSPSSAKKTRSGMANVITISPSSVKKNPNPRPIISIAVCDEEEPILISPSSSKKKTKSRPKLSLKTGDSQEEKNPFLKPFFKPKKRGSLLKSTAKNTKSKDVIMIESDDDDFEIPEVEDIIDDIEVVPSSLEANAAELAPFNLEELCQSGESLIDMIQRLTEDHVFSKIEAAQAEGRRIIGAEKLGIANTQPVSAGGAERRFREAWKSSGKKKRSNAYDPEDAMTGNYTFNYRGRDKEDSDGKPAAWKKRGRWGGRGRGRGRSRGRGR